MKRRLLIKHIKQHGCQMLREGANHTIYWNPANRKTTSIPRHTETVDKLAAKICKDLNIPKP
jgi:predicted RNA binding protein YcfA (HicA-like mRNA interferase family)